MIRSCGRINRLNLSMNGLVTKHSVRSMATYTEKQEKTGRPVSPHVMIYSFPIVAISSITNRITGVGMAAGFTGAAAMALTGADVPVIMSSIGSSDVGALAKFMVAFPISYHYIAAVRHTVWDHMPDELTNEKVQATSLIIGGLSLGISLGAAFVSF
mmetsp:Transcript_19886/g.28588  ORF Transcript_19886/g.28588 Transcript_19886/m.28588 type:complete len:157 (+) Transcript_19886:90-560(+)|eukprot:CAMPEP_0185023998 /NCGR_PEP_ID=MMETSP1103-20130426/6875_1 /TAXON_ID=36769 /ORGANISM="Paraphysomonas bandaiensis, Strain Caron Lab Isolate" /LENGTH=156 /DNA_ID=CAMNT_0027556829 /DNA_START=67 /DNA_END=537 /DNA_ORIENTATION=+